LYIRWFSEKNKIDLHLTQIVTAIFNDLQRHLTRFPRSRHCLTLNISEIAKHTAIVTTEGE